MQAGIKGQIPIIWLIDEDDLQLRTNFKILRRILPKTVEVRPIEAYPHLIDYIPILENPHTACIITDQKLKDKGTTDYMGIELAEFLRGINPKIPIYILTNYADDKDEFLGGEWSVEDIIKKSDLINEDEPKILAARILRRINVYEDILSEREKQFQDLLIKDMEGELEPDEEEKLEILRLQKVSPTLVAELSHIQQMEQLVAAHEKFMERIKGLIQKEGKDVT